MPKKFKAGFPVHPIPSVKCFLVPVRTLGVFRALPPFPVLYYNFFLAIHDWEIAESSFQLLSAAFVFRE